MAKLKTCPECGGSGRARIVVDHRPPIDPTRSTEGSVVDNSVPVSEHELDCVECYFIDPENLKGINKHKGQVISITAQEGK